jgi:hypothetical protein
MVQVDRLKTGPRPHNARAAHTGTTRLRVCHV